MSVFAPGQIKILTAATDDAAAAGQLFPVAGLYQATIDEIDDGDLGRLRSTKRRGLITSADQRVDWAYNTTVAYAGDIEQGTTAPQTGFSAAATTFFDGSDAAFNGAIRYVRLPMAGWRQATITIINNLTPTIDLTLMAYLHLTGASAELPPPILNTTLPYGHALMLTPFEAGYGSGATGRVVVHVPALNAPCAYIVLGVTPSADPSGGWWGVFSARN